MKPILEWYEDLPEPIRSQAIENYNPNYAPKNTDVENLHDAIDLGFWWMSSPEGDKYWHDISTRAEAGEFDKPHNP